MNATVYELLEHLERAIAVELGLPESADIDYTFCRAGELRMIRLPGPGTNVLDCKQPPGTNDILGTAEGLPFAFQDASTSYAKTAKERALHGSFSSHRFVRH